MFEFDLIVVQNLGNYDVNTDKVAVRLRTDGIFIHTCTCAVNVWCSYLYFIMNAVGDLH